MTEMERLVELAKEGNAQAQNALYCRYKNRSLAVCRRITHDNELSEELANDAFLIAFDKLDCLKEPEKFGSWLSAISARVALRHLKRKQEAAVPFSCLEGFDVACETSEPSFTAEELQEAIDRLPLGYRQVFTMSVIEGRKHKEIASILNIEPHSSSSQLYHARVMLRRMLEPLLCVLLALLTMPCLLNQDGEVVPPDGAALTQHKHGENVLMCECDNVLMRECGDDTNTLIYSGDGSVEDNADTGYCECPIAAEPPCITEPCSAVVSPVAPAGIRQASNWSVTVSMTSSLAGQAVCQHPHALLLPSVSASGGEWGEGVLIDNWRECKRYVLSNMNIFSAEVADALIRIAQSNELDNNGEIIRMERHEPPVSLCVRISKQVHTNSCLHCGVGYGVYHSWYQTGVGNDRIDESQSVTFFDIPVGVSCGLFKTRHFDCYLDAELAMQLPVAVRHNVQFVIDGQVNLPANDGAHAVVEGIPIVDLSSKGGSPSFETRLKIGVEYKLTKCLGLFSECGVSYNLSTYKEVATYATVHPVGFSLQSGLQFAF